MAIFALGSREDFAAEMMNDVVESVTDAEDGNAELERRGVGVGGVVVVDGGGSAGEDYAQGLEGADLC